MSEGTSSLRRPLFAVLAVAAVIAAFAWARGEVASAGAAQQTPAAAQQSQQLPVQEQATPAPDQQRGDGRRGDCPKEDGGGAGDNQGSSDAPAPAPEGATSL
jgi:hypothetical protein